ncbi:uncharacterized protein [Dysidea avara]|uniref:uncharacterized protein n=1 Tax=Dysidea avara TaxID=196820 RepID=UPI003331D705
MGPSTSIYLYAPNIIGYLRLLLLAVSWTCVSQPSIFVVFYSASAALDFLDGYLARRLKQISTFGAWLDVIVDNIGRTMLWSYITRWSWIIISLEWSSFVCTHSRGSNWKSSFERAPWLVTKVMDNGFYTPLGILVVLGLHVLPLGLYVLQYPPFGLVLDKYHVLLYTGIGMLAVGRFVCALVELWTVLEHIRHLVSYDIDQELSSLTDDLQKSRHNSTS